jgi:hypothetical protein
MSDQAPIEETPAVPPSPETGTPGTDQEQIDWQKRYEDLRPEYDRTTQRLSERERLVEGLSSDDPDTRAAAAQALGLQFVDDSTDDDQYTDPTDQLAQKLQALEARLEQRDQQAQDQANIARIEAAVEQQLAQLPDGLSEKDKNWIVKGALGLDPTPEGVPDIQAAYQEFTEWESDRQKQWAATKKAPHVSAVGQQGTSAPDLDDPAQRVAWMTERARELES